MVNLLLKNMKINYSQPILYRAKIHWISYVFPAIYTAVGSIGILPLFILRGTFQIFAVLLVILFCNGIIKIIKKKTTKVYVTEGYLSISSGIFSQTNIDISLKKMEGMQLNQTWLGRAFNYGTLIISTGGVSQSYSISNPTDLREKIIEQTK
jgi:uncharacterized membrane protein YdbT with pleckstrin-like domain